MKRTWVRHIFLLTALFHLFADVALAGGAVLCVGPNDHAAVEIGHLAPDCGTLQEARPLDPASTNAAYRTPDACTDCTDSPLHAEAEIASKRITGDFHAPAVALVAHVLPVPCLAASHTERTTQDRLDISTTLRAHRSIVLLI